MPKKKLAACLRPQEYTTCFEERYARRAAFLRRLMMGLFTFTMMMKTERITKSLFKEIRTFCMAA